MNPIVFHIASGHAFFSGIAMVLFGIAAMGQSRPWLQRAGVATAIVGLILIPLTSTAIPYYVYAIAIAGGLVWIVSAFVKSWRAWAPYVAAGGWLLAAACDVPHHFSPSIQKASARSMTVIGDSVTAGGAGGDAHFERWPAIFAREHDVAVQDISHMGDTVRSAFKRARATNIDSPLVFLEIGGNDVLGSTTAEQFRKDLDELLSLLKRPGRQLVMFELPLLPGYHEFNRHQRELAAQYGVALVPKRVFLSVLAGGDSTLDTIHLSQAGHHQMANTVWSIVRAAYE